MSETPQSFEPEEEWSIYQEPCPYCGSTEFYEEAVQNSIVYCDDNGELDHIEPDGTIDVVKVWCRGCDEVLFD